MCLWRSKIRRKNELNSYEKENTPNSSFSIAAPRSYLWSREDKATFYQACTEEAKPWTGSAEKAKTYCDCVFANMEKKYPNEEDALEHIDSLAKDSALLNCKGAVMVK